MTTTATSNKQIADTILGQLGGSTIAMLGARGRCTVCESGVVLSIRGSRKVNAITITLDPSDTYSVRFHKATAARFNARTGNLSTGSDNTVAEFSGIYADGLHGLIEDTTGLATSL